MQAHAYHPHTTKYNQQYSPKPTLSLLACCLLPSTIGIIRNDRIYFSRMRKTKLFQPTTNEQMEKYKP